MARRLKWVEDALLLHTVGDCNRFTLDRGESQLKMSQWLVQSVIVYRYELIDSRIYFLDWFVTCGDLQGLAY